MKLKNKLAATVLSLAMIAAIGAGSVSAASSPKSVSNNSTTTVKFGSSTSVKCDDYIPRATASSYRSGAGQTETFRTRIEGPARSRLFAYSAIVGRSGKIYHEYKENRQNYRTNVYATARITFNWFWTEGSKSTVGFVENKTFGQTLYFKVK